MMDVTTRPALASDTDFARQVHHEAYREVVERQYGPWDEERQDRYFQESWHAAVFAIVLCDNVPCGYLCVEDRPADLHVREIVILPGYQGQGIGSTLLRDVIERARQRDVPVRLGTHHVNRAANLYRRLGFREIGRTETHLLFEWRDVLPAG
jgi:ribosomal protein S18 acetylase RimI-like enzyme